MPWSSTPRGAFCITNFLNFLCSYLLPKLYNHPAHQRPSATLRWVKGSIALQVAPLRSLPPVTSHDNHILEITAVAVKAGLCLALSLPACEPGRYYVDNKQSPGKLSFAREVGSFATPPAQVHLKNRMLKLL